MTSIFRIKKNFYTSVKRDKYYKHNTINPYIQYKATTLLALSRDSIVGFVLTYKNGPVQIVFIL